MQISDLLDRAKAKANISSDYALAKVLGITTGNLSNIRAGRTHPSNEEAVKLATLAGLDEMDVIAEIELQTAKTEKKKEFWKHYIESRGITACIAMTAIAASIVMATKNAEAEILHLQNYSELNQSEIYIIRSNKQDRVGDIGAFDPTPTLISPLQEQLLEIAAGCQPNFFARNSSQTGNFLSNKFHISRLIQFAAIWHGRQIW
jgi:plasmid maintenance system antidote protein VapI